MPKARKIREDQKRQGPPAKTIEARERQVISMAVDLAERQILDGTASSQVITHFLKLGSTRESLEKEKLARENELLRAKTESLKSQKKIEDLYANALKAMSRYNGSQDESDSVDDLED
jgi:hypothetical protein